MDNDTTWDDIEFSAEAQHHPPRPPTVLSLSPLAPPPPLPPATTTKTTIPIILPCSTVIVDNLHHHRTITIFASIALFWSTVSLIPIYNKFFLQKEYYPYPMATTGIQLLCVSILLTCVNVGNYYYHSFWSRNYSHSSNGNGGSNGVWNDDDDGGGGLERCTRSRENSDELHFATATTTTRTKPISTTGTTSNPTTPPPPPPSYIFGPNFAWKLHVIFPVGFLFGLKLAIMNLGLHLLPTPTHLLLQSTDIIWTVLGARFINGERITSALSTACLCGCFVGTFLSSMQVVGRRQQREQQQSLEDGSSSTGFAVFAIGVNLISPMLMGLCVATLRSACVELMMDEKGLTRSSSSSSSHSSRCSSSNRDHRVCGTVGSVELTAIKTGISAIVALTLASIFESARGTSSKEESFDGGWYHAFRSLSSTVKLDVLGGSLPTLIFQVNCTFLAHLTSTVAVGLVGQLKIIPQWTVAMIFSPNAQFHMTGPNIFGALLAMTSAVVFAINEYIMQNSEAAMHSGEEKIELLLTSDDTDEEDYAGRMSGLDGHKTRIANYGSILR